MFSILVLFLCTFDLRLLRDTKDPSLFYNFKFGHIILQHRTELPTSVPYVYVLSSVYTTEASGSICVCASYRFIGSNVASYRFIRSNVASYKF
jgi:hypothetical protein